jgi:hypothetical protein
MSPSALLVKAIALLQPKCHHGEIVLRLFRADIDLDGVGTSFCYNWFSRVFIKKVRKHILCPLIESKAKSSGAVMQLDALSSTWWMYSNLATQWSSSPVSESSTISSGISSSKTGQSVHLGCLKNRIALHTRAQIVFFSTVSVLIAMRV